MTKYESVDEYMAQLPDDRRAAVEELGEELKPYAVGKGTIRFPADQPVPVDLVTRIIEIRNRQHAQEAHARKKP